MFSFGERENRRLNKCPTLANPCSDKITSACVLRPRRRFVTECGKKIKKKKKPRAIFNLVSLWEAQVIISMGLVTWLFHHFQLMFFLYVATFFVTLVAKGCLLIKTSFAWQSVSDARLIQNCFLDHSRQTGPQRHALLQ